MNPNFFTPFTPTKFHCDICYFNSSKQSDWNRHILTAKHKRLINPNDFTPNKLESIYDCNCGKKYKHLSSLCAHKKKCLYQNNVNNDTSVDKDTLISVLLTQNKELIELLKHGITNNITNNNTNNNTNNTNIDNKTFNLTFFLNETCKDAINITDFVSSIKVNLEDLENTGRQGYIQGITNIILKKLNNLEQHMRPLHCSNTKQEVLYIKDNDEWTKETQNKPILTKAIKTIANENIKQIKHWKDKHIDCSHSDSKKNDLYLKIVSNSMNGSTEEEGNKNISKIISNVAKEVTIDKAR
jgi:hypothetical protein